MSGFLPYGRQTIEDDDIAAVAEALRGDFLTTGPTVEAFETAFAQKVGAEHAIAVSNGTATLHLAMMALGVGEGDVCVAPSITFLATANCARYVGAEVVFADVDPDSGLMTPDTLAKALSGGVLNGAPGKRVKAVLPVHLRGDVCDLPALKAMASASGAALVEDAPHALGSVGTFGGTAHTVGDCAWSSFASFSFHPVKTLATGEGGMLTTNDAALAAKARLLRSHGMIREPGGDPWWYEMPELGFNYRIPDVLCALGLSQLSKLDRFVARRRELSALYAKLLAERTPRVRLAASPAYSNPALHLLTVLIDFEAEGLSRRTVVDTLKAGGIGTQVHYIPLYRQPFFKARYGETSLAGAEAYYARCLALPLFPAMSEAHVDQVVLALAEVLGDL